MRANVAHLVPLINAIKSHTPIEAKGHFARIAPQHVLAEDFHLFQGGIHHRFACSSAPHIGVGGHGAQAILLGIFELGGVHFKQGANAHQPLLQIGANVDGVLAVVNVDHARGHIGQMRPQHKVT